jgi:MoaA/NifB/PqqE/SkfB family radical SAM enzyme
MDIDLFKGITRQMVESGVEEIGLFYLGESFSNPRLLVDACAWCKQELHAPYVFLTTNGTLAKSAVVEKLMQSGLNSLKFSVNSADPMQYESVTSSSDRLFYRSLANLRAAWAVRERGGYATRLYASSIRYNGEQQAKMEALLDEHVRPYVDEHYFLPLYGMALTAERMRRDTGWTPAVGNVGRYDDTLGRGNRQDQAVCWALFTEGHVRSDGHLSACCFGSTSRFDVGDLTTEPFMDAWNGTEFRRVRGAMLEAAAGNRDALRGTMCEVCVAA